MSRSKRFLGGLSVGYLYQVIILTDFLLLGEAPRLLTLDSDILFFKDPQAFLAPSERHIFQRDPRVFMYLIIHLPSQSSLPTLHPCINVGMMHFRRDSISLERCNDYLSAFEKLDLPRSILSHRRVVSSVRSWSRAITPGLAEPSCMRKESRF